MNHPLLRWLAYLTFALAFLMLDIIATPDALRGAMMLFGE